LLYEIDFNPQIFYIMEIKNYSLVLAFIFFGTYFGFSQVENTFYGINSGMNNTTNFNTAYGVSTLFENSGNSNNAFGWNALKYSKGGFNCAFGNDALKFNSFGEFNSAIGTRSLEKNLNGSFNIALGHRSLGSNIDGSRNTAIGYGSLLKVNGNDNIALGYQSPRSLETGNSNIFIGNETGVNLISGNHNVFLGAVRLNNSASTNRLAGNSLDRTIILADGAGTQKIFVSRAGNTGLGLGNNVIPNNRLDVNGGIVIGKNYTPNATGSDGFSAPANGLLVEGKVGVGTSNPKNKLEITHGTDGNSGLRLTNLTSNFNPSSTQTSDKFLSVNQFGDIVLQKMANSSVTNALSSSGNTMTNTINGNNASASIVNTISNSFNNNNQLITTVNGVSSAPINIPIPNFSEIDESITNEIQVLSINGNTVSLSLGGGSITLPTLENTDEQTLTLNGNTISISGGNSITLPTVVDTDTDEQTLSLNGNVLSISNGNSVNLPTFTNTDSQSLTLNGNTLSISGGNSITIPTPTFSVIQGTNTTVTGNGSTASPFQISSVDKSLYANDGSINQASTTNNNRRVNLNSRNIWFDTSTSTANGKIYIGSTPDYTSTTGNYKLFVEGGIMTEKVKVSLRSTSNWADYVFEKDYNLKSLNEVEKFINKNKHLPGIPSAKELAENGIDVVEMQSKQMEKIEELTLYIIDQNKKLEQQNEEIQALKSQMNVLIQKMK
jgi:trimeric autotransporter adhesin